MVHHDNSLDHMNGISQYDLAAMANHEWATMVITNRL